ncbi:hypothetical protein [Halomarina ordinaria]|uniref:Uncharacterized protein n=1 Tax=Halomarina ordinaria TaxID=3033939 RepID=A0ABD5UB54_9EURY|nr:hypothetical protein [Halomarina sp. PSRA2]
MVSSLLWGIPRRVVARILGWVSANPLRFSGGVAALLAAGYLYDAVSATLADPVVAASVSLPVLALDVARTYPAYVLAVALGTVALVRSRS